MNTDSLLKASAEQSGVTIANQLVDQGSGLTVSEAEFIPFQHHDEWIGTKLEEKQRIKGLLGAMQSIHNDPRGIIKAIESLAAANRGRESWSFGNLKTLYYAWKDTQDWRVLRRNYRHQSALPPEFVRHLSAMVLREHRSRTQAIERVRAAWRAGEVVPGYGTWREWFARTFPTLEVPPHFAGDYPPSWSDRNLRNNMPSRAQHTLATKGLAAAQRHLPHLIRDTSKLRPLELVVFDDFKTDIRVCAYNPVLKKWEVVPCMGLLAMDVATRRVLHYGLIPRLTLPRRASRDDTAPLTEQEIENDEAMRKIAISRRDLQLVLKGIFQRYGVPSDYCMTLLVENAAAAITAELEAALEIYFHGQVRVCRTNMLEHRTLANGFTERGGKPWEKGWIESAFNLMHNIAGNLPGQTGSLEQENAPGDLAARIAYTLAALEGLTPEQAAQAKLPVLDVEQATAAYGAIFDRMDQRGEHSPHRMLGFDRIKVWRRGPGENFKPLSQLQLTAGEDPAQLEIVDRVQSPRERWACLMKQVQPFRKVPEFVIALLAFTPTKKIAVRNHKVTFTQGQFKGTFLDLEGQLAKLPEGTKVIGYYDEQAPTHLFVTNLEGAPLAVLERQPDKTDITNPAEVSQAQAIMARFFQGQVAGRVAELLAPDAAQAAADRQHNNALRASHGLDPINLPAPNEAASASRAITPAMPDQEANATEGRATLSRTLARDAFAPAGDQFAAAERTAAAIGRTIVTDADRRAARAEIERVQREAAKQLTSEEIAAATQREPASETNTPFSAEEIADIFRDDPKA
jgi:hypothetical protein